MDTHSKPAQAEDRQRLAPGDGDGGHPGDDGNQYDDDGGHAAAQITPPPKLPPATPRRALLFIGVAVVGLLAAGGAAMLTRIHDSHVLADETQQNAIPTVSIVHPIA